MLQRTGAWHKYVNDFYSVFPFPFGKRLSMSSFFHYFHSVRGGYFCGSAAGTCATGTAAAIDRHLYSSALLIICPAAERLVVKRL